MPISINFNALKNYFSNVQHHALVKKKEHAKKEIQHFREHGKLGFMDLPTQTLPPGFLKLASKTAHGCKTLLVIGIGGSSLGAKAALSALEQKNKIEIVFLESPNPHTLETVFSKLDWKKTAVNVISKSGTTLETISIFLVVYEKLKKTLSKAKLKERIFVTTETNQEFLHHLSKEQGFTHFEIPKNVGGRFSVLSSVGLFPMAVSGLDIQALLKGADQMLQHPADAYRYAAFAYGCHTLLKRPLTVLFPYDERLSSFSDWFCQLWAESLGKTENSGPTPMKAIGPMDQHSLLQLFLDGPRNKWFTFLSFEEKRNTFKIKNTTPLPPHLKFLLGKTLSDIHQAECKATQETLAEFQNPLCQISAPHLNAETLGALFAFFELATVCAGHLYGINPLDQPAVEHIKEKTKKILS